MLGIVTPQFLFFCVVVQNVKNYIHLNFNFLFKSVRSSKIDLSAMHNPFSRMLDLPKTARSPTDRRNKFCSKFAVIRQQH